MRVYVGMYWCVYASVRVCNCVCAWCAIRAFFACFVKLRWRFFSLLEFNCVNCQCRRPGIFQPRSLDTSISASHSSTLPPRVGSPASATKAIRRFVGVRLVWSRLCVCVSGMLRLISFEPSCGHLSLFFVVAPFALFPFFEIEPAEENVWVFCVSFSSSSVLADTCLCIFCGYLRCFTAFRLLRLALASPSSYRQLVATTAFHWFSQSLP